ncbi:hypothetical protein HYH03_010974 [Edaphochlamys debaryana]|uniref:Rieske domain-containing protein n=1 Tax=Edaphochlamys debaryana TaxID=47281 RepID=A0A835Y111_9CHLO|nr:hypothetical protein HYH03_010974 [Edaphochlamys debaryana]|eukprot:KAG2490580.1 hypothetical protein HYH03_010974 [Edaphochlamys debaryana]
MALWRDSKGAWRAVEDRCPHRLAPLSEGRLESDGTLQCAYHGWQFDGRGACTHIPQLRGDDKAQQVACASRRSCVRAFPVQEVHGLLWVLPDSSEQAWERASEFPSMALPGLTRPPAESGLDVMGGGFFCRDLPIRFDTLCENLFDPAHVHFAHHSIIGVRQIENGTAVRLQGDVVASGFECSCNLYGGNSTITFQAPGMSKFQPEGVRTSEVFYGVPTKPGWSRIYAVTLVDTRMPAPKRKFSLNSVLMRWLGSMTWFVHAFRKHPVLDSDTYLLHVQERLLLETGNDWKGGFYMPAPADGSVVAMRRWFDEFGGAQQGAVPTCEPGTPMPAQMTKRQTIDRYSQHTAHCRHCSKALRNTERGMAAAAVAGVVAAVWLVARALVGAPLLAPATALGAAAVVACGLLVRALAGLREQFRFVDFVHAFNN